MIPNEVLYLGQKYSKSDLSDLLDQPNLSKVREGVYNCTNSASYLLFVDLEKKDKEERFHFNDFFEEDFFHWDSQTTQHIDSPKIQDIINGVLTPHLFVRLTQKIKNVTQPFIYCGRLTYSTHEDQASKPVHILFQSIDYDDLTENEDLVEIYLWRPYKDKGTKKKNSSSNKQDYLETRRKIKESTFFARNPNLKRDAIKERGCQCEACKFKFGDKYGEFGANYIECHHEDPLSERPEREWLHELKTSIKRVKLLCSNCHRMIHRTIPAKDFNFLLSLINDENH